MFYERIGPALEHAAVAIDGQLSTPRVQDDLNIFPLETFADLERLAEQVDVAMHGHLSDEADPPGGNRQWFGRDAIAAGQLAQLASSSILRRRQASQAPLDVLVVDGLLQPLKFALQRSDTRIVTLEQAGLESAVEMFDAAIAFRMGRWD